MSFHNFNSDISSIELLEQFTCPFCYTPHPLTLLATKQLTSYIAGVEQWQEELSKGKMFGVLVVKNSCNQVGFLAAFSGLIAQSSSHPYFVGGVYDLANPSGYFKIEEGQISKINIELSTLLANPIFVELQQKLQQAKEHKQLAQLNAKESYKESKKRRKVLRAEALEAHDSDTLKELDRISQFEKGEIKRLTTELANGVAKLQCEVDSYQNRANALMVERKERSAALQQWLFTQFTLLNSRGESRSLLDIFATSATGYPPAGAGECAAPRLLQYAFLHQLTPIAMGEFWWGESPLEQIRHHGQFYPSCKGKCEPILGWMLQGMSVESNKFLEQKSFSDGIEVVYEDEYLLGVVKPSGMLSVDGNSAQLSLVAFLNRNRESLHPLSAIHRLDMDTSGVLLLAKDEKTLSLMQKQFASRAVEKEYTAVVEGQKHTSSLVSAGEITLKLMPNYLDRPRQMVSDEGKSAVTRFEVVDKVVVEGRECSKVRFFPLTGRTHQLRLHAAHQLGLDSPIVGDNLYGFKASRLYLHACSLTFTHPFTKQRVTIVSPAPF